MKSSPSYRVKLCFESNRTWIWYETWRDNFCFASIIMNCYSYYCCCCGKLTMCAIYLLQIKYGYNILLGLRIKTNNNSVGIKKINRLLVLNLLLYGWIGMVRSFVHLIVWCFLGWMVIRWIGGWMDGRMAEW